ncbi:hypothetical protein VNO77_27186 [Canavalia gladiata]|uniref:Uncharacterized protein n=1 Tax=Canavalia gladiata TaxID=3824 RepID=A0AAN9KWR8_CANGL
MIDGARELSQCQSGDTGRGLFGSHSGKIEGLDRGHHRRRRYLRRLGGEGADRKHWRVFLVLGALFALGTVSGRNSKVALVEHGADEVAGGDGRPGSTCSRRGSRIHKSKVMRSWEGPGSLVSVVGEEVKTDNSRLERPP